MTRKKYLIIFGIFVFMVLCMDFFIKSKTESPAFFDNKIIQLKNDVALMEEIGGYRKVEYSYSKISSEIDTLRFKITIYGKTGNLVNKGRAIRNTKTDWRVINEDVYVQE